MTESTADNFQRLLAQAIADEKSGRTDQADAILDELLAHELDVLTSAELMERATALRRKIRRRHDLLRNVRIIAAVVLVNAAVIAALLTIPVGSVEIQGLVEVTEAHFQTANVVDLTPPTASTVTLTSFDSLEVDAAPDDQPCAADGNCEGLGNVLTLKPANAESSVTLDAEAIVFEYLRIFPGTTLNLRLADDGAKEFIVGITKGSIKGEILTPGLFTLRCTKMELNARPCDNSMNLIQTGSITLRASQNPHITLAHLQNTGMHRLSKDFRITGLEFKTFEPHKKTSSVVNGTIRLLAYSHDPINLEQGDLLTVAPSDDFSIMQMTVGNTLALRLTGRAATLGVNGRQLKPNLLEWLREHAEASLFVGVLISFTSFLLPLLQRMDIFRES